MKTRLLFALLGLSLSLVGCATPQKPRVKLHTEKIYHSNEVVRVMNGAITGDQTYAQVDSKAIVHMYDEFRSELFQKGIVNGGTKFDCNHFSSYFISLAQTKYYCEHAREKDAAQNLALGQFWYRSEKNKTGHAIVVAITERGVVYFDPTLGREIKLSDGERASAFIRLF